MEIPGQMHTVVSWRSALRAARHLQAGAAPGRAGRWCWEAMPPCTAEVAGVPRDLPPHAFDSGRERANTDYLKQPFGTPGSDLHGGISGWQMTVNCGQLEQRNMCVKVGDYREPPLRATSSRNSTSSANVKANLVKDEFRADFMMKDMTERRHSVCMGRCTRVLSTEDQSTVSALLLIDLVVSAVG